MSLFCDESFFILPLKYSEDEMLSLRSLIKEHGGRIVDGILNATTCLTKVASEHRIMRHLDTSLSYHPAIILDSWIKESIQKNSLADGDKYTIVKAKEEPPESKRRKLELESEVGMFSDETAYSSATEILEDDETGDEGSGDIDPRYVNSAFECCRPHPLHHHNPELVEQLKLLEKARRLEGQEKNALSYRHAISALISYPREIKSIKEAAKIVGIGEKIKGRIKEYLEKGYISEAEDLVNSSRYLVLEMFSKVFGCGDKTARGWYAKGYRTIEQLRESDEKLTHVQRLGLELYDDFQKPMNRSDVEEILSLVKKHAKEIDQAITMHPVGGYRRGKLKNGDVDVILSHPVTKDNQNLLRMIISKLQDAGLVKNILQQHEDPDVTINELHPEPRGRKHLDALSKAFTAFLQPSTGILRQVDIIIAPPDSLVPAVVGWTGSTQYERSLRLWCKRQKGDHVFNNKGLYVASTRKPVLFKTEAEFFEYLGLPHFDPTLRNA